MMNVFLGQVVLAARDRGVEGWMNVLFIVAVAIFYAIGSIIKAKANKRELEEDKGPSKGPKEKPKSPAYQQRLRPVRPTAQPARQRRPQVRPPTKEMVRPQPAVEELTAEMIQGVEPAFEEVPGLISKPLEKLEDKRLGIQRELTAPEIDIEPLLELDFGDADALKRAILYREILGRPVGLRDLS